MSAHLLTTSLETAKQTLRSLRHRDPFLAYDMATTGVARWPEEIFFRQVQAYALARTGSLQQARGILEQLHFSGRRDPETLGLLGSVWKDLARDAGTAEDRTAAFQQAANYYGEGLRRAESKGDPQGYYPGVNAATVTLLLGDESGARTLAARAKALAEKSAERDYWVIATLGECALILGDPATAELHFRAAAELSRQAGQMASTRRQARMLASKLLGDASRFDDCFYVPDVLVFAGHLTDAAERETPRFPESMVAEVAATLQKRVANMPIGFAGAARGADILFLEALQSIGAETHVVLPLEQSAFMESSVRGAKGEESWCERYNRVLACAHTVRVANSHSSYADGATFEYGTRILLGLAILRAQKMDSKVRALVVWDGKEGGGPGGTAWCVAHMRSLGIEVENIYPGRAGIVREEVPEGPPAAQERQLHTLLFADCKGYSKMREELIGKFTCDFLAGVARIVDRFNAEGKGPVACNTWGDGMFMAFRDLRAAGNFAMALRKFVQRSGEGVDLPEGVCIRIGLHAGPVLPFTDPLTHRQNFAGINVAFAARIEPITPENQVCVSEPFAALAAEAGLQEFRFEYLGQTPFAKGYGEYPLYLLSEAESNPVKQPA